MSNPIDVIALAREAGLCFPDCHFLDSDPYADVLTTLVFHCPTEQDREDHLRLVKEEEARRQERLHQLELFAALVIRAARNQVDAEARSWQEEHFVAGFAAAKVGAAKAAARLEIEAMALEQNHQPHATVHP